MIPYFGVTTKQRIKQKIYNSKLVLKENVSSRREREGGEGGRERD